MTSQLRRITFPYPVHSTQTLKVTLQTYWTEFSSGSPNHHSQVVLSVFIKRGWNEVIYRLQPIKRKQCETGISFHSWCSFLNQREVYHRREKSTVNCVYYTLVVIRMDAYTIRTHECTCKSSKIYDELSS